MGQGGVHKAASTLHHREPQHGTQAASRENVNQAAGAYSVKPPGHRGKSALGLPCLHPSGLQPQTADENKPTTIGCHPYLDVSSRFDSGFQYFLWKMWEELITRIRVSLYPFFKGFRMEGLKKFVDHLEIRPEFVQIFLCRTKKGMGK